jgi:hypothetical protein
MKHFNIIATPKNLGFTSGPRRPPNADAQRFFLYSSTEAGRGFAGSFYKIPAR